MCAKVKFSQVGECFSKTEKIVIFRDFSAIFRNKNIKLAYLDIVTSEITTCNSTFVEMLQAT